MDFFFSLSLGLEEFDRIHRIILRLIGWNKSDSLRTILKEKVVL